MRATTYQGCGMFWVRAILRWDTHTEIVEWWFYERTGGATGHE